MGAAKGDTGVVAEMPTARSRRNTKHRNHRYMESRRRWDTAGHETRVYRLKRLGGGRTNRLFPHSGRFNPPFPTCFDASR